MIDTDKSTQNRVDDLQMELQKAIASQMLNQERVSLAKMEKDQGEKTLKDKIERLQSELKASESKKQT